MRLRIPCVYGLFFSRFIVTDQDAVFDIDVKSSGRTIQTDHIC